MANECAGCEARQDEIRHLRQQVADLTDRAMAAANPQLHLHLKNPTGAGQTPAITSYEDGMGNAFVQVDGKAVPFKDWQKFINEHGGYIDDQGRYVPEAEVARAQAKLDEMMGGNAPSPTQQ